MLTPEELTLEISANRKNIKALAEFEGYKEVPFNSTETMFVRDGEAKWFRYESHPYKEWNGLMPIIKKIKDYLQNIERPSQHHCCKGDMIEVDIQCYLWSIDFDKTLLSCVEFINWYNQNK